LPIRREALRVSAAYFLFATAWIVLSDLAVLGSGGAAALLSVGKGLAFVAVTAVLLHLLLRRRLAHLGEVLDALRASEARYRAFIDQVPVSLWEEDFSAVRQRIEALRAEGVSDFEAYFRAHPQAVAECFAAVRVLEVNAEAVTLVQAADKAEVLGGMDRWLFATEFQDVLIRELAALAGGARRFEAEIAIRTIHGERRYVDYVLIVAPGHEQDWSLVLIMARDISRRKAAEAALAERERLFRGVFEQAGVGVVLTEVDGGRFVRANRRFCELLGYSERELLERNWIELTHPDDRDADQRQVRATVQGDLPQFTMEKRYLNRDGTPVWAELTVAPVWLPGEQPDLHVAVIQDIRARKRAEQELRDTAEALRDAVRRQRMLAARTLSIQEEERARVARELHDDVGQALTAITLQLHAARHRSEPASALDGALAAIERALQSVRGLSRDLRPPQLDELGLGAALEALLDQYRHGTGLALEASIELPAQRLDFALETTCYRVAQEAVTNAIRHAGAGCIRLALGAADGELVLAVRDDGQGFNLQEAQRRALRGASVGLLGMEERVELLGGRLQIDSSGRGTLVRARLPLAGHVREETEDSA